MSQKAKSKIIRKKKNIQKKVSKKTPSSRTWKQWVFIISCIVFILITSYILACSNLTRLKNFEVRGVEKLNDDEISSTVQKTLQGNLFSCIKKDNYFFVSKKNIIDNILKNRRIKNVIIEKKFPQTLIITIEEYKTIPIWCVNGRDECFIIENDIIATSVNLDDDIVRQNKTFIVTGEDRKKVDIGEQVISSENLAKIETLGEELVYVLDAEIQQPYVVISRGSNEVRFMTDEGWYVVVDLTQDVDEILTIAKLFIKNVDLPSSRNDLEYVDMRFSEKIFYKMKEGVEQLEESENKDVEVNDNKNDNNNNEKKENKKIK